MPQPGGPPGPPKPGTQAQQTADVPLKPGPDHHANTVHHRPHHRLTRPLRGPVRAERREPVPSSPPAPAAVPLAADGGSTPAKVRLTAYSPVKAEPPHNQDPASVVVAASPTASVAVRRVDVVPQGVRAPRKPPATAPRGPLQYMRQPLYPMVHGIHPLAPRLLFPRGPRWRPLRPSSSSSSPPPPVLPPLLQTSSPRVFPPTPPSPAITRLSSSSSSRKRPSLTRSKSDMSDRCSRAGTELERFFNLCGLDPAEVPELAGVAAPGSDIVSLARFRSASAPGSEVTGLEEDEEEEDGGDEGAGGPVRVPYGVSVIEKNARVIKWLYGMRQEAKDTNKSTNM
ncbi:hypothetical protein CRUP_027607 [Coryphaenoides rupestris]|nr:hypothetical protein CRUP_027607 [Coryphaenoides rupestris]